MIQEALDRLMQGRTTLILAHRLSSVIDCDRILVLDGGKVAEQGRHDDADGAGRRLCRADGRAGARAATAPALDDLIAAPARAESVADTPGGAVKPVTEGIIKAEGLDLVPGRGRADEGDPAVEGQAHRAPSPWACCASSPSSASACCRR